MKNKKDRILNGNGLKKRSVFSAISLRWNYPDQVHKGFFSAFFTGTPNGCLR